jgi:TolB protein
MVKIGIGQVVLAGSIVVSAIALAAQGAPQAPATAQRATSPAYNSVVMIYDVVAKTSTELYRGTGVWEAANWSRDGRFLLVNSGGKLFRLAVQGPVAPEPLGLDPSYVCNNDHDFSADGRRLAFSASTPTARGSQVFVANADGSDPRQVVPGPLSYFHGWSPDGKYVAFVGQRDGKQYDLYRVPAAGGDAEQLTATAAHEDGPDYTRDGRWIYFNSDRAGGGDIWRMPPTGAGPGDRLAERVTSDAREDWFPHPSPDGKLLVFLSFPAGTKGHNDRNLLVQLRAIPLPGDTVKPGEPQVLVEFSGGQGTINVNSWSPDSKRFAYVKYEPAAPAK